MRWRANLKTPNYGSIAAHEKCVSNVTKLVETGVEVIGQISEAQSGPAVLTWSFVEVNPIRNSTVTVVVIASPQVSLRL